MRRRPYYHTPHYTTLSALYYDFICYAKKLNFKTNYCKLKMQVILASAQIAESIVGSRNI